MELGIILTVTNTQKLTALVLAWLIAAGAPTLAKPHLAPAEPLPGQACPPQEQVWADLLAGDFCQARQHAQEALAAAPDDVALQTLSEWIADYCDLANQREQLRHDRYTKLTDEAQSLARQGHWDQAAATAAAAFRSAATAQQFRDEPWARKLLSEATEHADELRRRGEWLAAATIFASLRQIFPDEPQYKDQLRICGKHARFEAVYTPENESQWQSAMEGADAKMIRQTLDQISLNYVSRPDFKEIVAAGMENLLVLAETPQMADVFENLAHPELVGRFTGRIRSILDQIDQQSFVSSRTAYQWFNQLAKLNRRTLALPDELLVIEFMDGVLDPLDDFSSVIWPSELTEFKKHTTGEFSGVGIQISMVNNQLTVITPLEDTPAYDAGIQPGDVIVGIDGQSAEGITLTRAVQTITGLLGTQVVLTVKRQDQDKPFDVPITRARITIQTVKGYSRVGADWDYFIDPDLRIAYVRLTSFMERTTQDLRQALDQMAVRDVRGLILDLRFNHGGLLRSAIEVSDMFLDGGQVIVSTEGRTSPQWSQKANLPEPYPDLPLIVLLNDSSASASEIVAGAIQDNHRGLVVGQRSYGKGSVQNLIPLGNGSAYLKLTTAFYYLPSGRCIDRQKNNQLWGVAPDIRISLIPEEVSKVWKLRSRSDVLQGKAAKARRPDSQPAEHLDPRTNQTTQPTEQPGSTSRPAIEVPDVDPQLEAALLVMRTKLISGLSWDWDTAKTIASSPQVSAEGH